MSAAIPFDTLAFVKELEGAGVPPAQAEAQAKALSGVLQKVEESHLRALATKGDIELAKAELRKDIETAKVETIKWVIATGIIILGGVATINRLFPPVPVYYQPHAQEMRLPAVPPAPPVVSPSPR
ncbi:MAG: DUF1640 domain-containing protein [Magnetococcales bacterium]|nr:DUF1640 domain-containing protein [Magnetococcales bacterium]MBF0149532.1 DUF1640 domain-containing protein [Magnetococcales bacterium]MBF0174315.1 DUF1640 domain-containing protein [Magnetococcales bacterium]MBF0633014.1 DUF1640 domain-containing protein [Magnetococcales bacterium]